MERVIEIMQYVMKHLLIQGETLNLERELMTSLAGLGYSREEIEMAFRLLHELPDDLRQRRCPDNSFLHTITGYRIFNSIERSKLSFACQSTIFQLLNSALITKAEVEQVMVELVLMESKEVGLKELELILHKVISDEERLVMILSYPGELSSALLLN